MSNAPQKWERPTLRLVNDETLAADELRDPTPADDGRSVSGASTLRQFFLRWFLPIVLCGEMARNEANIKIYLEALDYWERYTKNPPLRLIDEYTIARFSDALRSATYRRGPLGKERPLSLPSQNKHKRTLRAILGRIGPTLNPDKPAKHLVDAPVRIKVEKLPKGKAKPSFGISTARRIYALAGELLIPSLDRLAGMPPGAYMQLFLSLLFFTGLRSGTVLRLRWDMLEERDDGWWLDVPGTIVHKTGKPLEVPVGPHLLAELARFRTDRELICPLVCAYDWIGKLHKRLQRSAGLSGRRVLEIRGWRRTHGTEVANLGVSHGMRMAQMALDHAAEETTAEHYVSLAKIIRALPPLREERATNDRQGRLF